MNARPCKKCNKMIVLAQDRMSGKWIPLDTVAPCYKQIGPRLVVREEKAMVSHYCTCPYADEFSKSKNKKDEYQLPLEQPQRDFNEPKEIE